MKRILRYLRTHDISVRVYLAMVFLTTLTAILIGMIFMKQYRTSYLDSQINMLTQQGESISKRVTRFATAEKPTQFGKYNRYIEELESAEQTDVWIVSNEDSGDALSSEYTNAGTGSITKEMTQILQKAFQGEQAHSSSYDQTYGMTILRVGLPIYARKDSDRVSGAVMMICMLDNQTMGLQQGRSMIFFSALAGMLLASLVAMFLSRSLSGPLDRIDSHIMQLANGHYKDIQAGHTNSQLGRLEQALDRLSGKLRRAQTEQEALDKTRRDFFANVSHELRTPITVIRGYTETLSDGLITDQDTVTEYYQRMLQECIRIDQLVGDLFTLSKMQNPDFVIDREPISLTELLDAATRSGAMVARAKQMSVVCDNPYDEPCLVLGDYQRLQQALMILLDNAVKFSEEGSTIRVGLRREKKSLTISVEDHGIGISKEELPYIFEKFYKSKLKQNESGTGLGLMIAHEIVAKHGSTLQVTSRQGQGTTFYFSLKEISVEDAERM